MSVPTPGDFVRAEKAQGLLASDGPCGDAPLDDALHVLVQAGASFELEQAGADVVLDAAASLHERIQTRLEEAR